jgi:hypothetical protein
MYLAPPPRWFILAMTIVFAAAFFFILVDVGLADTPGGRPPITQTILGGLPVWPMIIAVLTTGGAYVVNHFAFWGSEEAKGFFQLLVATVAGALTQLVDAGTVGFDAQTAKYVIAAILTMMTTHLFATRTGLNAFLGGGTNRDGTVSHRKRGLSGRAHKRAAKASAKPEAA